MSSSESLSRKRASSATFSTSARVSIAGLGLGGALGHLEWGLADDFGHAARAKALGADVHRLVGAAGRADVDPLQIRLEGAAGDAGDLRTDAAEVLLLTTDGYLVALLRPLAADFA